MTRDHVCLASIDWNYLWQGPQEVMTRLARSGSKVVYVEHAGIRRPYLADWRRVVQRVRDWSSAPAGRPADADPRITIVSPLVLPFPWSAVARAVNKAIFARRLPDRSRRLGLEQPVVWTFVPTPLAVDTLGAFRGERAASVYYCVADFEALADDPWRMRASENELLHDVGVVLAGGRVLQRRLAQRHRNVVLAPFSVSDSFFGPTAPEPADIEAIPRPRVAYVGGLHRHVDQDLLASLIPMLPDVHFVFIGPKVSGDWAIEALPNAHFIGRRPHDALPAYIDAMDACFVPYRLSPFTVTVWPTKLHEYFARGKPAVSTPLDEVLLLGYTSPDLHVAGSADELRAALLSAIAAGGEGAARRVELAREYSWDRTMARILAAIERVAIA
jgi:UDP-galactopyranose mutase